MGSPGVHPGAAQCSRDETRALWCARLPYRRAFVEIFRAGSRRRVSRLRWRHPMLATRGRAFGIILNAPLTPWEAMI